MPLVVGETFERYEIEALLGRGGMGEVYRAVDTRLRRKVAIKVIRPDRERPSAVPRLFREARAAAALSHPNTVAIYDLGEADDGTFYIVMELVRGTPMIAHVGDPSVTLTRKLAWLGGVARALSAAHKAGVIHRDVKPSNVMIGDDDAVKVLDFGLAKPIDAAALSAPLSFQTQSGRVLGTPRYMAPELLRGADEATERSDQYAFGLTAYELLAGELPSAPAGAPPPPMLAVASGVPASLARTVERMLAHDASARYATMADVAAALDACAIETVRDPVPRFAHEPAPGPAREAAATESTRTLAPEALAARPGEHRPGEAPLAATLGERQGAHARAHEAARTLLTKQAPSAIVRLGSIAAPAGAPAEPPPAGAPIIAPKTSRRPPPPSARAVDAAGSRRRSVLLVVIAIAALSAGAFAGTYLGARRVAAPRAAH